MTNLQSGQRFVFEIKKKNGLECYETTTGLILHKTIFEEMTPLEENLQIENVGFQLAQRIFTMNQGELLWIFDTVDYSAIFAKGYPEIKRKLSDYDKYLTIGECVMYKDTLCVCVKCNRGICMLISNTGKCYDEVDIHECKRLGKRVSIAHLKRLHHDFV